MQVIKQLKDISKNYNVLFCDIWGCIHNGKEAYQNALNALVDFKRNNGFVMLLTNAPRPKNAVKAHLSTFGISEKHFNDITTSGDAAQNSMLSGDVGTKVFHLGPKRDLSFFNDIPPDRKLTNKINVVELRHAEGIVCTGLFDDRTETPENYKDLIKYSIKKNLKLLCVNPDIFVVVAYKILPPSLINLPRFGSLNLHASLLPKYRGAGPIQWALINGDKTTGVTIFQISSKVDTGEVLDKVEVKIEEEDNMFTLGMRLCTIGADLMQNVLNNLERGNLKRESQDVNNISFAPKITREMSIIDWSLPAERIHNWVRGLSPWPGMYTTFQGKKIILFKLF